jgi:hypothetical protein
MRYITRVTALAVALVAVLACAGGAAASPSPGYGEFAACPDRSVDSAIFACQITTVEDGHLKLGSKNTPIIDPIVLTAGVKGSGDMVLGTFDGGRQQVPGGLVGITGLDWLIYLFPNSLLGLYAEAELAGPLGNAFAEELSLPLKVRLINPILTSNCYIGSNSNPIALSLTTGTTNPPPPAQPITGQQGTPTEDPVLPGVFRSTGVVLVDNEFSVPGATGCGLLNLGLIDGLVNLQAGLPAAAGRNEAVQEATGDLAIIEAIYQPAGFETP